MRFGIFRREFGSFAISRERVFRLIILDQMCERKPGAGLTFFWASRGFEGGGSAQKTLGLGAVETDQHQSQVKVRLEYFGLGGDRLPVGMDRVLNAAEAIENESEIEPCLIVLGIFIDSLFQQSFRGGEIVFLDGIFGLRDFWGCVVDAFLVMADGGVGLRK